MLIEIEAIINFLKQIMTLIKGVLGSISSIFGI